VYVCVCYLLSGGRTPPAIAHTFCVCLCVCVSVCMCVCVVCVCGGDGLDVDGCGVRVSSDEEKGE
jgi:hypothetical protein